MAYAQGFGDPNYWNALAALDSQQPRGALAGQPAAPPGPLSGGDWRANLQQFLDPQVALPIAAQLLGGQTARQSLAGAFQTAGEAIPGMRQRAAANAWLKSQSGLDLTPEEQQILQANPELVQNIATARFAPRPLVAVAPGSRLANPLTGQFVDGGAASGRGDGSAYDLEQAGKLYKTTYGEGANTAIGAPEFMAWYKNIYPTLGQGGSDTAAALPSDFPRRPETEQDVVRNERISSNLAKPIMDTPVYKLVSTGGPYLARIEAAAQAAAAKGANKSVLDNEILDSLVKLNTGGGQVTEANVNLITHGGSITDKINVLQNYMSGQGGVLSDDQRNEAVKLAREVFQRYQQGYKPFYAQYAQKMKENNVPSRSWTLPDVEKLSSMGGLSETSGGGAQEGDVATGPKGHQILVKGGRWVDLQTGQPIQ